jgi:hypothetical protein
MSEQIVGIKDSLLQGITAAFTSFMEFIPALIGGLVVLLLGWFVAKWVGRLVERLLYAAKFEQAVVASKLGNYFPARTPPITASSIIGALAKWFVFLIFVQAAANVLRMPQITAIINSILLFLPHLFLALVIVVIGTLLATMIGGLVESSLSKMKAMNPKLLALITRYAVLGFTVIAAVNQLGIATNLINIMFTGLIGSIALAFALAFGLGGQSVASEITRHWYSGDAPESGHVKPLTSTPPETKSRPGVEKVG